MLMLDVPAVALGLLGFALSIRACERERASLALGAGLVLGLAMQTKYSAVVYPALAIVQAALQRRPREGAITALAAAGLFVGWEALLFAGYGQSHFLAGLERLRGFDNLEVVTRANAQVPGTSALFWTLSLLSLLGSTAPYAALLALVGLGARWRVVAGAALVAALAFAAIPAFPRSLALDASSFFERLVAQNPELLLFVPLGAGCRRLRPRRRVPIAAGAGRRRSAARAPARSLAAARDRGLRRDLALPRRAPRDRPRDRRDRCSRRAPRRAGRASADARAGVWIATAFGLALATLFFSADLSDARARRALIERIGQRLSQLDARGERAKHLVHRALGDAVLRRAGRLASGDPR